MVLRPVLLALLIEGMFSGLVSAAVDTAVRLSNVGPSNTAYVRVANDPAFTLSAFTLEAWVQRIGVGYGGSTDGLGAAIIAKPIEGASGSYLGSWHLNWTNSGQLTFTVVRTAGSSGVFLTAPAVATPLGRHHVAATFDGDTLRAFVDGTLAAQAGWTLGSSTTEPMMFSSARRTSGQVFCVDSMASSTTRGSGTTLGLPLRSPPT